MAGEVSAATIVMRPWQRAHSRTSSTKTRQISDAQGYRRRNGGRAGSSGGAPGGGAVDEKQSPAENGSWAPSKPERFHAAGPAGRSRWLAQRYIFQSRYAHLGARERSPFILPCVFTTQASTIWTHHLINERSFTGVRPDPSPVFVPFPRRC